MGKDSIGVYINRELSWLKFNERVLEEAEDNAVPLLERLKFVSIFASNLDEFFMVRVGSLYDQSIFHPNAVENKCHMTAKEQMNAIFKQMPSLVARKDAAYADITEKLTMAGITKINFDQISFEDEQFIQKTFTEEIVPLLSPQIVDKHHPFPFLKNKEMYVGIHMQSKQEHFRFGIVPVSLQPERVLFLNTEKGIHYVLMEELIYHFADSIFTKYAVVEKVLFRITRNADIDANEAFYDEDMDWRDVMQDLVRKRRRLAAVRLQVNQKLSDSFETYLTDKLNISKHQIFEEHSPFDISFAFQFAGKFAKTQPNLVYDLLTPVYPVNIDYNIPIIEQARCRDLLLAFPYHSIRPFIRLLEEAADDPAVISIKITLYRVAKNSQILSALLKAVENGKDVTAVLELRARFDEQNNIDWSKQLEEAGCTILYGLDEFKVHSKLLLITRKKEKKVEYLTQIGTGNYNEKTSELYTDLSMITTKEQIGIDALNIFNALAIGQTVDQSQHLWVAPNCLLNRLLAAISNETARARNGQDGFILFKCNSITDKDIIDKLIEASQAGVKIKLFVRGICCFRAGIKGYTENIMVKSIVGRYLEHSRIYLFGKGERRKMYIASADLMTRNTQRRIEVAAPVTDPVMMDILEKMLDFMDRDNVKARIMQPDGNYIRFRGALTPLDSQRQFFKLFANEKKLSPHLHNGEQTTFWNKLRNYFTK